MPRQPVLECPPEKLLLLRELIQRKREIENQIVLASLGSRPWQNFARPKQLPPHNPRHHLPDAKGFSCGCAGPDENYEVFLLCAGRGLGKLIDMSTSIPVPSGWIKLGDIQPGDLVFDEAGRTCQVTAIHDAVPEVAYRLWFSDGTSIDACSEHQWVTWTHADRKTYLRSVYTQHDRMPENWPAWRAKRIPGGRYRIPQPPREFADSAGPRVRTTEEIAATFTYGKRGDLNHSVPVCSPLELPEHPLLVHPYVLGVWLGDGTSTSAEFTSADPEVIEAIRACGETVRYVKPAGGRSLTYLIGEAQAVHDPVTGRMISAGSLHSRLRALGVLQNKHVPPQYLRASASQRLALLQGLMDTDGHAGTTGISGFCTTAKPLAEAVTELARSLSQKPIMRESRVTLYGRDCGPKWRVTWRPTVPVYQLQRKLDRVPPPGKHAFRNLHRMIVRAERIPSVPMRCLTVDSPNHMYLAGEGMIPTHNTLSGANNLVTDALAGCTVHPGGSCHQCPHTFAVCAPTRDHLKQTCFEGDSGVLSALEDGEFTGYNKSLLMVTLRNGNVIRGFSAENEERYRGPNLSGVWVDELGVFRHEGVWHQMRFALRIGAHPRIYVTTTPRPTKLIRQLFRDVETGKVHLTTGSTDENADNLSKTMLESLHDRYGGTRMGRQELEGSLLEDVEGSLWQREWFDRDRVSNAPADLTRVVVAMDPAVTTGEDSDETGIIVAAQAADGHAYVLADFTRRDTPFNCCRRAVDAYYEFRADAIVGEQNNGGDYIRDLVHSVDPGVAYRQVYATRGKATRAQPVSSLYEQGKVHHVGSFPDLEDQMSVWLPDDLDSPDRLDATVWAIHWLRDMFSGAWSSVYGTARCTECGQMVVAEGRSACPKCGAAFPVAA